MDEHFSCPVYKKCGGCQLDVSYPEQLSYKQCVVTELLGHYGRVEPILSMENPLHYRCKVSSAFGFSRGRILSGVWQSSSGRLVPVENCALEDPHATAIVQSLVQLMQQFRIRSYDAQSGQGVLRFVTIRVGRQSGQILVALGTGRGPFPRRTDFVRALTVRHPEITTIVQCISTDRHNLVLGTQETVLYGPGWIVDRLCGCDFRISARSFFQVNPVQTEVLYRTAVDFAGLDGSQIVIDAYCGVGTVGILAAGRARRVLAVEQNSGAVRNAQENIRLNGVRNLQVYQGDAGVFMTAMAEEGQRADVVFTDPPRAGCSREFLRALLQLSPQTVVYISCNPETLARDLQTLTRGGYRVRRIRPVDMFPNTKHIETVVLLSRGKGRAEDNRRR